MNIETLAHEVDALKMAMIEAQRQSPEHSAPEAQRAYTKALLELRWKREAEDRTKERVKEDADRARAFEAAKAEHVALRAHVTPQMVFGLCSKKEAEWQMMAPSATGTGAIFVDYPVFTGSRYVPYYFATGTGVEIPMNPREFFTLLDQHPHTSLYQACSRYIRQVTDLS